MVCIGFHVPAVRASVGRIILTCTVSANELTQHFPVIYLRCEQILHLTRITLTQFTSHQRTLSDSLVNFLIQFTLFLIGQFLGTLPIVMVKGSVATATTTAFFLQYVIDFGGIHATEPFIQKDTIGCDSKPVVLIIINNL